MRPELALMRAALDRMAAQTPGFVAIVDLSGVPQTVDPVFLRALVEILTGQNGDSAAEGFELHKLGRDAIVLLTPRDAEQEVMARLARLTQTLESQSLGHLKARHLLLPQNIQDLLAFAQGRMGDGTPQTPPATPTAGPSMAQESGLVDLTDFAGLERALYRADIAGLVREQPIYRVTPAGLDLWGRELWVSIEALERQFQIGISNNPWMFGRVTELLDRRMIYHLVRDRWNESDPLAINLHCSSVLSEDFGRLLRELGGRLAAGLTAELPYGEYRKDPKAFVEAATLLGRYGVAIALDLVPWADFLKLEEPPVPLKAIKVFATAEELFEAPQPVRDAVRREAERLVLIRCDRVRLIDTGRTCGFQLFQGRIIADWIAKESRDRRAARLADEAARKSEPAKDDSHGLGDRLKGLFGGKEEGER